MPPPDPSQPNQQEQQIRSVVLGILSDPLQLPDELTTWLSVFVSLNGVGTEAVIPTDHNTKPTGP